MTTISTNNGHRRHGTDRSAASLRRWLPVRVPPLVTQPGEWARSLAERYSCSPARTDALGMTMLDSFRQNAATINRWFLRSQFYFPKINLTIQSYLRAIDAIAGNRTNPLVSKRPIVTGRGSFETMAGRLPTTGNLSRDGETRMVFFDHTSTRVGSEPGNIRAIDEYLLAATGSKTSRQSIASPMELAFRRSFSDRIIDTSSSLRISERSLSSIIRRVTKTCERIELTDRPSLFITKAQQRVKDPAADSASFPAGQAAAQRQSTYEARQSPQNPVLPQPNIDQLTNQVLKQLDRKIVAARERVGKTF